MKDELTPTTPASKSIDHWKWLVGSLGGLMIALQAFGWIESRIAQRVEERVLTATAIARLDNSGKDARTWMDGRVNTLSAEIDGLRRELTNIRADMRSNNASAPRVTEPPATPTN